MEKRIKTAGNETRGKRKTPSMLEQGALFMGISVTAITESDGTISKAHAHVCVCVFACAPTHTHWGASIA